MVDTKIKKPLDIQGWSDCSALRKQTRRALLLPLDNVTLSPKPLFPRVSLHPGRRHPLRVEVTRCAVTAAGRAGDQRGRGASSGKRVEGDPGGAWPGPAGLAPSPATARPTPSQSTSKAETPLKEQGSGQGSGQG